MLREQIEEKVAAKVKDPSVLAHQIRDYCQVGIDLVWQRQVIFFAALGLASFYYSLEFAASLALLIVVSEAFDFWLFRKILHKPALNREETAVSLILLCISTVISASIIVTYAVGISILQGTATHFMPLFFLFAAALFAAMNNHQILPILIIRLSMYGAAFLFIPIKDVWMTGADIHSELWAQLFTSVFVLFFVVDCSRTYLRLYRSQLSQLRALQEEHERSKIAYRAKTEFVSTMSHELRTPLTSIKGSVDLLNSGMLGKLPDQAASAVSIAQRNCNRLLTLINEILDLQSVEANKMNFDLERVGVQGIVKDSIADIRPFADKFNVTLTSNLTAEEIAVRVDKKRLGQVFSNILSNAVKFSPEGSKVAISVEKDAKKVRVLFADEGVGISEADHEKVFGAFSQVDSSDTRKIGGTGLGMNISKRIMEELSGRIFFRSNENVGTVFVVELPREPSQPTYERHLRQDAA